MLQRRLCNAKRRPLLRAALFTLGYILSPLTFWNDAFVNVPLAYVLAYIVCLFLGPGVFPAAFFAAYNATNVIGLLMMHVAVRGGMKLGRRTLLEMIGASIIYTLLATMVFNALLG